MLPNSMSFKLKAEYALSYEKKFKKFMNFTFMLFICYVALLFANLTISGMVLKVDLAKENELKLNFCGASILLNSITYQNYYFGFITSLHLIHFFLDVINDRLYTLLRQPNSANDEKALIGLLRLAMMTVDKTCEAMEVIKKCHAVNTICFSIYFSFYALFCFYGAISYFLYAEKDSYKFFMLTLSYTLYNLTMFLGTFTASCSILRKCDAIEIASLKFLSRQNLTTATLKAIETLCLQLHHRRPIYSCGLFAIDWKFLFFLISMMFSYLIIFFQFDFKTY